MSIKIEYSDYVESRTPIEVLDGTELLAGSKDGTAGRMTTQQIAGLVVIPPAEVEDYVQEVVDTTGDTIMLDLTSKSWGNFSGSATFSAPRTVVLDNEERAGFYYFNFEVGAVDVPIDFGEDAQSPDARFVDGVFTPQDVGLYTVHAIRRFGTDTWLLNFRGVYSVGDAPPTPTDQWILSTGIWNNSEFWDNDAIWRDTP